MACDELEGKRQFSEQPRERGEPDEPAQGAALVSPHCIRVAPDAVRGGGLMTTTTHPTAPIRHSIPTDAPCTAFAPAPVGAYRRGFEDRT